MRIGRLFGIEIHVDVSWLLVATLMTFNLTVVFGHWHPSWGVLACGVVALMATVLFFAMLLAHELAHALVAQSLGMHVTSIRLFLFGGVSNIDQEPPSASGELAMALSGPIVSIGLGLGLLVLSTFLLPPLDPRAPLETLQHIGPVTTLVVWLGPMNVGLGLFNMLPAFPLDGGRVVRALAWMITKELDRATRFASALGQFIGWSMVALGLVRFFVFHETMGALWLAFIGWFIVSGARRSYESLRVQHALEGVRVRQLMRGPGPIVPPDITVRELVERYFLPLGVHALHVADDDRLVGVVTSSDIWRVDRSQWDTRTTGEIMTPAAGMFVADPNELIVDVLRRLAEREVTRIPVIDHGAFIGVLELHQIAVWLQLALAPKHMRQHWTTA